MREINIANVIIAKRKEKSITQDTLAEHMGVTKASVSKWETAQSYPDITLLPMLATYFNISIDELMGYMPQMTKEDIQKTYRRLMLDFETKSFDEVYENSQQMIKKYYACFPFLLQMALLYLNHHMLAGERPKQLAVLSESIELCRRIKLECEDVWIVKQANSFEALGFLMQGDPVSAIDLLEHTIKPIMGDESTLASAYQMMGERSKAKSVLQICMYQHLMSFIGMAPLYFQVVDHTLDSFNLILDRLMTVTNSFNLEALNPNVMAQLYYASAIVYDQLNARNQVLEMLEKYTHVCLSMKFPLRFEGDDFFDALESWFQDFDLGNHAPRGEKVIKDSMLLGLTQNPIFLKYQEEIRYIQCLNKLKYYVQGGHSNE